MNMNATVIKHVETATPATVEKKVELPQVTGIETFYSARRELLRVALQEAEKNHGDINVKNMVSITKSINDITKMIVRLSK